MGEPMDRSKRVFWTKNRSFEDAYPTVEAADVEYTESGSFPDLRPRWATAREFNSEPRRRYHSIRHDGGLIFCSNPRCRRGGYEIDRVLSAMRQAGETIREGSLPCPGDEGSPKGRRLGDKCRNSISYKLTVKYTPHPQP
jgi:hypothetical protein